MHFISFLILQFHLFSTFSNAMENSKMLYNFIFFQNYSLRGNLNVQREMHVMPFQILKT